MKTNYRNVYKSDHLGVVDLEEMIEGGTSLIVTISHVKQEIGATVAGKKGNFNIAYFTEKIKPLVLNSTNATMLKKMSNSSYVENWSNITIELFIDNLVRMKGEVVGGVRIRSAVKPPLPSLTDERFQKALQSIADGKMTADKLKEMFNLTKEQLSCL